MSGKDDGHGKGGGAISDAVAKIVSNVVSLALTVLFVMFIGWGTWNFLSHGTIGGQPQMQNTGLPLQGGGSTNNRPSGPITGFVPPAGGTQGHVNEIQRRLGPISRY